MAHCLRYAPLISSPLDLQVGSPSYLPPPFHSSPSSSSSSSPPLQFLHSFLHSWLLNLPCFIVLQGEASLCCRSTKPTSFLLQHPSLSTSFSNNSTLSRRGLGSITIILGELLEDMHVDVLCGRRTSRVRCAHVCACSCVWMIYVSS